jgi:hypothetical protein
MWTKPGKDEKVMAILALLATPEEEGLHKGRTDND